MTGLILVCSKLDVESNIARRFIVRKAYLRNRARNCDLHLPPCHSLCSELRKRRRLSEFFNVTRRPRRSEFQRSPLDVHCSMTSQSHFLVSTFHIHAYSSSDNRSSRAFQL